MLIDMFVSDWQDRLHAQHAALTGGRQLVLLLDGAFLPDFYRVVEQAVAGVDKVSLLFALLPGCSSDTRAVSPFLVPFSAALTAVLKQCSGWPMLGAIETTDTVADLAQRLSAWCIVEHGNQRFNFRFPDTRRLPLIVETLTAAQRSTLTGPAQRWSYIGRDGTWAELTMPAPASAIADHPILDDGQFAAIVDDSAVDETIVLLRDRGPLADKLPSEIHALVQEALRVADLARLESGMHLDWCAHCLRNTGLPTEVAAHVWRANVDKPEE